MVLLYLLLMQISLVFFLSIAAFWIEGSFDAIWAVLYGGLTAAVSTTLIAYQLNKVGNLAKDSPRYSSMLLLFGIFKRFILVSLLFWVGFGILSLMPMFLLAGFFSAQLAYVIGPFLKLKKLFG